MNGYQKVWWRQAQSDHDVFILIRGKGVAQCHSLHHLQMLTEKIAKAYFWRSGHAPSRTHAGFTQFLRFLGQTRPSDRERVANLFTFKQFADFQKWIKAVLPIAYELERLAPALANNGPNPEYPWPHDQPEYAPASYNFAIWSSLASGRGRDLMRII
jgi:hypothetical protein